MKVVEQIPKDWLEAIRNKWSEEQLSRWSKQIEKLLEGRPIAPVRERIFHALELCPLDDVKVLILGQDPYPTKGHANGLAFSTEDFVQPFPKSLLNIFKELKRSIEIYNFPLTGNLTPWAKQGVLLLNTCLTTEIGEANQHRNKGWESFTLLLIEILFEKKPHLVGMFWGNQAQECISKIPLQEQLILRSSHPSPLSVYRGFDGCNHFELCNDFLKEKGEKPIEWQT